MRSGSRHDGSHRFAGDSVPTANRPARSTAALTLRVRCVMYFLFDRRSTRTRNSPRSWPLKAQVIPVGIAEIQLLHAIMRDFGLLRCDAARTEVSMRRIHHGNQIDILLSLKGRGFLPPPAGFAGPLRWVPPTCALTSGEDHEEASLLGCPPIGLLDGEKFRTRRPRNRERALYPRPKTPRLYGPRWVIARRMRANRSSRKGKLSTR